MVVPCFASSGGQQIGYLQPLFCPSSFTNLSSDYSYGGICDIPNSFYFGGNGGYQSSVTWDQDMFNDMNVVGDVTLSSNTLQSGYGYSYINADFYSHLTLSSSNQVNTNLAFYYDDVYLPYQLIQNNSVKLNWLSDLTFSFEGATPTITRISFKINYINKDNDRFTQKSKTASLQYDGLIDTSRGVTDIIYNWIQNQTTQNDRLGGVVISDLAVIYPNISGLTDVMFSGTIKCVLPGSRGFAEAHERWADYRTVIRNTIVNNDTVVGSLVNGINDVWKLNLFGEFTIGALFSACVGVILFIWILKIFAGG